ncbi:MAG: endonuclease/exonuclease/phosphatase family protein, partial [Bacteroidota bacterium]
LFSIGCLLVGWNFLTRNVNFQHSNTQAETIRVMSYNMEATYRFHAPSPSGRLLDFDANNFIHFLEQRAIDIAVFQEFALPNAGLKSLQEAYRKAGYYAYKAPAKSIQIVSKYPILEQGYMAFEKNNTNGCLYIDVECEGKALRIYGIHLQSNQVSILADEVASVSSFQAKEIGQKVRAMFVGYKNAAAIRATQVQKISAHLRQCPHPAIICGDFNDVPQSYAYQQLAQGLQDTFQEKGWGIGTTYSGVLPFLRIDYVLAAPQFTITHQTTERKVVYSDHYPVIAEMEWNLKN